MNNYIIKNITKEKKVLLYSVKESYSFSPQNYFRVSKITVINEDMIASILMEKIISKFNKILKLIYHILSGDDNDSATIIAYTEIARLQSIILSKYARYIPKDFTKLYLNKLYLLERELKKIRYQKEQVWEKEGKSR